MACGGNSVQFATMKMHEKSNFFMSLLILDPKSRGRKIDVYLQPLIEELKNLWTYGVRTHDCVTN